MNLTLTVGAGQTDRDLCPVQAVIPEIEDATAVRLYEEGSGRETACQAVAGGVVWLLTGLPRNAIRRYRLVVGDEFGPEAPGFGLNDRPGEALDFAVGGKLFTSYNYAARWYRPFFHPVIGPGGQRVTRSWPVEEGYEGANESHDHPHHKGIWVAHGEVNGANDWADGPKAARMIHRGFERIVSGPVFAEAREDLDWSSADGMRILSERRRLAVYNLPGEERLLDVLVALTATDGAVTFGDTKEAGILSVRVASSMEGKRGVGLIENGFGGTREVEAWGKTAPWCHYSGPVGGVPEGIGVFDHPSNPRFPTNWHVRDYGLLSANCFGYHDFFPSTERNGSMRLAGGETVAFRYRVYLHRGDAAAGKTADRWADFAFPPAVGVEE